MKWGSISRSHPALRLRSLEISRQFLNGLQEGDVLFVDEIHRLNRQVEEVLYPAMEDFVIDIMIGKRPGSPFHPAGSAEIYTDRSDNAGRYC